MLSYGPTVTPKALPPVKERIAVAIKEAGAIIIKEGRVLLVRSNKKPHPWFFPKGHVEAAPPELPEETAVREVEEETGVVCVIQKKIGELMFERETIPYEVQYYLAKYVGEIKPKEPRSVFWCPLELALKVLTISNARELLLTALEEYE